MASVVTEGFTGNYKVANNSVEKKKTVVIINGATDKPVPVGESTVEHSEG